MSTYRVFALITRALEILLMVGILARTGARKGDFWFGAICLFLCTFVPLGYLLGLAYLALRDWPVAA
ncbi:MAG: hypothetical protein F6K42_34230, partial [Leptolyngbya sp. SIO1D8]|nr:hypothetical protein [Leptolyngbya sp. SIO1D8]